MVNRKVKIPNNEHISSIVSSWSFMVAQPVLLNPIEVIVPNNSKGFSIHINSEAKASFQSVVFPSSLLAFFPWIHIFERTNFIHNGHPWIKVFKKPSFLYCSSSSSSSSSHQSSLLYSESSSSSSIFFILLLSINTFFLILNLLLLLPIRGLKQMFLNLFYVF